MAVVSQHTVRDVRADLFNKIQKLPTPYFDKTTHGELISRTTNDMETVLNTLNQSLAQFINSNSVLTLVGVIIFMLVMDIWLTLVSMVIIPIVFYSKKCGNIFTEIFQKSAKGTWLVKWLH